MRESTAAGNVACSANHVNDTGIDGRRNNNVFQYDARVDGRFTHGAYTSPEKQRYEPIAIVGCAMRLPGGVDSGEALWNLLDSRLDGRCRVPYDRYNVDAFYGPGKPGHVATEFG
jgi:hypothetical protein